MDEARGAASFGLGRGLEALIPAPERSELAREIAVEDVTSNPHQPRRRFGDEDLADLTASIAAHGLLQPVIVRALPSGGYQLIAGERRLRAARRAGLATVPAVIRQPGEAEMLELALVENLQRSDLNAVEQATAFHQLVEQFGMTHQQIAERVGRSRAAVSNTLRLLELSAETRAAVVSGIISEGHGRALAALTAADAQSAALAVVVQRHLSVRQTEELVRRRQRAAPDAGATLDHDLRRVEEELRAMLATKVSIERTRRGGRIVIGFGSDEELDRIHAWIKRGAEPWWQA